MCAGTADLSVAEEAATLAELCGVEVRKEGGREGGKREGGKEGEMEGIDLRLTPSFLPFLTLGATCVRRGRRGYSSSLCCPGNHQKVAGGSMRCGDGWSFADRGGW